MLVFIILPLKPYAKFAAMKVLLLTIQEDPPSLDSYTDEENEEQVRLL